MSSFYCDKCGALCSDTERGYVSGCKHYPADISAVEYQRRMDKIIAKGGAVNETLIALLDEASRVTIASDGQKKGQKHGQTVSKATKQVRKFSQSGRTYQGRHFRAS